MRVNVAIPEAHVQAPVLDAALEATTRLNESLIHADKVPMFRDTVERVRWKPEPPGEEHFDHAGVVLGRGWGDCDDLAPWHAASLRTSGEDRGARAIVKRSGPNRWHAVVRRSDGSIDDPSREAGMGRTNGVLGGVLPLMLRPQSSVVGGSYMLRPQLALRPVRDREGQVEAWQARADLPWHWLPGRSPTDVAMVSLHASPVSSQAVVGACHGLLQLGEANDVDDHVLDRAAAIADGCNGASWEELADMYGEEHATAAGEVVGSFFGGLGRALKKAATAPIHLASHIPGVKQALRYAMPLAQQALPFVPGVGPIAAQAFRMASPALQQLLQSGEHLSPHQRPVFQPSPYGGMPFCQPVPY